MESRSRPESPAAFAPTLGAGDRNPPLTVDAFALFLGMFAILLAVRALVPRFEDVIYLLPFLGLFPLTITGFADSDARRGNLAYAGGFVVLMTATCLAVALLALARVDIHGRILKEIWFLAAPALSAFVGAAYISPARARSYARIFLFWMAAVFVATEWSGIVYLVNDPTVILTAWLTSYMPTESGMAFIFGLLTLYFVLTGSRLNALVSGLLLLLSFKRIAIFGVLFALMTHAVLRYLKVRPGRHRFALAALAVAGNLIAVALIWQLTFGHFDAWIQETTGFSTNGLLQGRQYSYRYLLESFQAEPWLGLGLGETNVLLARASFEMGLIHSDVLKLFVETGPVVFLGFFFWLYAWTLQFDRALVPLLYLNVVFLTDNVLIYLGVMLTFYLVVVLLRTEQDPGPRTRNTHAPPPDRIPGRSDPHQ